MIYHVTCNTDNNYAQHCCAMLCSLFENNKELKFHVHILTHSLSNETTDVIKKLCQRYHSELTIYDVDESKLEGVKFRKFIPLTKAAYYRILLPEIIDKSISKILYLDCDIIVLGNIKELFDIRLDNYALAACEDLCPADDCHRRQLEMDINDKAFCSGLMMVNLKFWRDHSSEMALLEFSKKDRTPIYYHDQDALNYVFKGQWYSLPFKWGKGPHGLAIIDKRHRYSDIIEYVNSPGLIHYANYIKPWSDVWTPRRKYYNKYLRLSEYPNIKISHVNMNVRMKAWMWNLRYYLNGYIRPFVPNFIEIIIKDVCNLLLTIYTIVLRPKSLNSLRLNLWLNKYKI